MSNPEDVKLLGGKVDFNDQDVERTRRAHLNDMENIYLFFSNASFYLMTEPDVGTATALFNTFTAARYLHTIFYLGQVRIDFAILLITM